MEHSRPKSGILKTGPA